MRIETASWIATGVAGPIIAVWLGWTTLIIYYHRKKWRLLDPLLVIILFLAIIKQLGSVFLTTIELLRPADETWCSALTWLLSATHTMEAGTLTTLIFSKFLHLYLPRDKYRKTLSKSHLIYHLACLALISSCIGVAAVIGKTERCVYFSDKRYVSFWLTLHSILILLSFLVMLYSSCIRGSKLMGQQSMGNNYYQNQRRLLLNSSSDLSCALSDISMISSTKSRHSRVGVNYSVSNCSSNNLNRRHCLVEELLRISSPAGTNNQPVTFLNASPEQCKFIYNTQMSNGSCHNHENVLNDKLSSSQQMLTEELRLPEEVKLMEDSVSCAAMHDCHLSTTTTSPSSTNSRAPVLGARHRKAESEVQLITVAALACLCYFTSHLPVMVVAFMDTILHHTLSLPWSSESFPIWTSLIEGCLLPVVLLIFDDQFPARVAHIYKRRSAADVAGKPPQGLYGKFRPFNNSSIMESRRPTMETVRFPITNGSLFTSLDGRIPIVHNYRRGKCIARSTSGIMGTRCLSKCSSGLNDHGGFQVMNNLVSTGDSIERKPAPIGDTNQRDSKKHSEHILSSQCFAQSVNAEPKQRPAANGSNLDSLPQTVKQLREKLFFNPGHTKAEDTNGYYDSSDEDPVYATLSSQSICSATTAANDDFEFFQHDNSQTEGCLFDRSGANSATSATNFTHAPTSAQDSNENCKIEKLKSVNSNVVSNHNHNHNHKREPTPVRHRSKQMVPTKEIGRSHRHQAGLRDSQRHHRRDAHPRRHPKKCRSPIVKQKSHWRNASCNKPDRYSYNNQRIGEQPCRKRSTSLTALSEQDTRSCSSEEMPLQKPSYHRYHPLSGRRAKMGRHSSRPREFPPTPPTPRRLAPILSVDSLVTALNEAGVSYLDNGEVYTHPNSNSVPDLKKIFITDFL